MASDGRDRLLTRLSLAAAVCALGYALYRAYYGVGGTLGMIGVPRSDEQWRAINLVAAALILGAGVLPLVALKLWHATGPRRILLGAAWIIAVACIGHALINDILRVASLAGLYDVSYPPDFWVSVDRTAADLQDLLFNETWFLVEGLLWATIASTVLGPSAARRWWITTMSVAVVVATVAGLLSAFGVIGRVVVG
jgi:hypothetical protein